MFIPRVLKLKENRKSSQPVATRTSSKPPFGGDAGNESAYAKEPQTTIFPVDQPDQIQPKNTSPDPKPSIRKTTPEYIAQIAAGIELIFTDYAHEETERATWLQDHYRTVNGVDKFIHLAALLEHPNMASMKPEVSQPLIRKAIQDHPSNYLELSEDGYHVRRRASSYPLRFLPKDSFEVVDNEGLAFWDQRTIYIEPHLRALCKTPGKIVHWLQMHGQMRSKWLPIQAVHMLWNSCAFVVLSGNVMHDDIWRKWRAAEKPQNWKIMTKFEHTKRTIEYLALLAKQNPGGMRKDNIAAEDLPAIARPAVLPISMNVIPTYSEQVRGKKRRKKRKICKSSIDNNDEIHAGDRPDQCEHE